VGIVQGEGVKQLSIPNCTNGHYILYISNIAGGTATLQVQLCTQLFTLLPIVQTPKLFRQGFYLLCITGIINYCYITYNISAGGVTFTIQDYFEGWG
jgi:hypothetical protein